MRRKQPALGPKPPNDSGAAMLIAIFALLLISVVAIALVVSSGTDASLAGNYRTSTSAYYAGVAGLEEARGRLLWKNQDFINKTGSYTGVLFDSTGTVPAWCTNQVLYITNPGAGETVDPTSANPANYPDTEYVTEFPGGLSSVNVTQIPSVSSINGASLPGPTYKWVRINAVTEPSLNLDVNGDGTPTDPGILFYDPANLNTAYQTVPGLVPSPSSSCPPPSSPPLQLPPLRNELSSTAVEALEITALAVAPNGGRRVLQYIVAPLIISPDANDQSFSAALILDGNGVVFQSPSNPSYRLNGVDNCNPPPPPGLPNAVPAVGYTDAADYASIFAQANPEKASYPGFPLTASPPPPGYTPATPSLANLNLSPPNQVLRQGWQTPTTLDAIMQDVVNSADVVIPGPATGTDISNRAPLMSAANPMTIVVNGDLNLNGWHNSGFGLLLVTGALYYDPDATWNGVVLVVGQGVFSSSKNGVGGINGAVLVAKTRDSVGNLLPGTALGSAFYGSQTSFGSNPGFGISYNSCMVNTAKGPLSYKVLSFHEVPLP
ncbi:MAG TPA: pilus assembly PilX N-terminal domain-containing protein [Candidatus Acidoferrum sp.]|nr:pilus assembly PilX N-terminal domain-containing protein [Candidatus Acidoferrum sp.]